MPPLEPRQTVILAAGFGQRLGSQDHGTPKPLMRVSGRPLIEYALAQAAAAGCGEAIVVIGNSGDRVQAYLESAKNPLDVRIAVNPDYHLPNGVSLLAAEPFIHGPFFLQMSDHLFGEPVLARLAAPGAAAEGTLRLLVDRVPVYSDDEDATKVCLDGGMITSIGKELPRWDAVDTGCFLLDPRVFNALREVKKREETSVTAGMQRLIAAGIFAGVELHDVSWVDVDTPLDQKEAEKLFGAGGPFVFPPGNRKTV
jgi:choline kinase